MSSANWSRLPNFAVERQRRQIRDVSDHAGDTHARRRRASCAVVVAPLPIRIGSDRVSRDRIPGDALRLERVGARDWNDRADLIAVLHGPLECLHAAQRPAGNDGEARDPELVQQRPLGPHHVADGDHREVGPVGPTRGGVRGRGSGRAAAASEKIRTDDEKAVGVEGLAGTDHAVPPAETPTARTVALVGAEAVPRAFIHGHCREAGRVRIAAQRVADQNHVVAGGRERAIGLVRDADGFQLAATVERQRPRKLQKLRLHRANRAHHGLRRRRRHPSIISPGSLSQRMVAPMYDPELGRSGSEATSTLIERADDG